MEKLVLQAKKMEIHNFQKEPLNKNWKQLFINFKIFTKDNEIQQNVLEPSI